MFVIRVLVVSCICSLAFSEISQKDACQNFFNAVVQIDAGGVSNGTGFLVSRDGWIFTAAHVVRDLATGKNYETVTVTLPSGRTRIANYILPIEANMAGRDYAILKIDGDDLPHLDLGTNPKNPLSVPT